MEKDPVKQKELYQKFMAETIASHVVAVEKQLKKNNTGYLVGKQVSWPQLAKQTIAILNHHIFLYSYS